MSRTFQYTVIGAGHGGKAMAAHLSLMGFPTKLYNRTYKNIETIHERGGIELTSFEGGPHGFAELLMATSDIDEAVEGSDVIMVVTPSNAHADIAKHLAPFVKNEQVIVLNPGRTGGCLEFRMVLQTNGCKASYTLVEAETLIYAARSEGPARSRIFGIKEAIPIAALPASSTEQVLTLLKHAFPQFINGNSVLHTGLNNMGAIFHPALTLLNAGRIESTGGDFQFYIDGVTPSVARVLEVLDRERVTVAAALGLRARTALEWLKMAYGATGKNLFEAIHNQEGYFGIKAPTTLTHRYITEDVPMSLVPIASFAQRYGVSVRGIESIIRMACIIHQTDYWRRGRTLDKLGIHDLSVSELNAFVKFGTAGLR